MWKSCLKYIVLEIAYLLYNMFYSIFSIILKNKELLISKTLVPISVLVCENIFECFYCGLFWHLYKVDHPKIFLLINLIFAKKTQNSILMFNDFKMNKKVIIIINI